VIRFFRLKSGDDIVADYRVVDENEDDDLHYIVKNPLKLIYFQTQSGKVGVTFMSWVFPKICEYQQFKLYTADVLTVGDVSQYITDSYLKVVGDRDDADTEAVATATQEELQEEADAAVEELFEDALEESDDFFGELNPNKRTVH
jgi:hypothetical protein